MYIFLFHWRCRNKHAQNLRKIHTDKRVDNNLGEYTVQFPYTYNIEALPTDCQTSGQRIRYARVESNISKVILAKKAGISLGTLHFIENGLHKSIRIKILKLLAHALNRPAWFLGAYDFLPEKTLAEKLFKARRYRLMTVEDAAAYFGISIKTYRKWELNKSVPNESPKIDEFINILMKKTI